MILKFNTYAASETALFFYLKLVCIFCEDLLNNYCKTEIFVVFRQNDDIIIYNYIGIA